MTIAEIVTKFVANPSRMRPGATSLAKRHKCTKEDIYEARRQARAIIKAQAKAEEDKAVEETIFEKEAVENDDSYCVDVQRRIIERTFWNKLVSFIIFKGWK